MEPSRSALIVAGDTYSDPGLRRLRAPASDARALAGVLSDPGIGGFDVRTVLNEPAHEINLAVEEFFDERRPDDLLLLHFSCHGVKDSNGDLYFAAANTVLRRLGATAVSADFVNRLMSRSRSRRVVLLLDCCYAGAFERGMVARAGTDVGIEAQFGGRGRAVVTASSAMEYAFEGNDLSDLTQDQPSVFTSALVEGLATGDADRDQDGQVDLDELYDYVYDSVRAATPNQTPGKWTFGVQGDLIIAQRSTPVTAPSPLPPELRDAIESRLTAVRLAAVSELSSVLAGRHGGQAVSARLALELLTEDDSRAVASAASTALGVEPAAAPIEPEGESGEQPSARGIPEDPVANPMPVTADLAPDSTGTGFVVAGALGLLGAVLSIVALFPVFSSDYALSKELDNVWEAALRAAVLVVGALCLFNGSTRQVVGPGLLLSVAALAPWGVTYDVTVAQAYKSPGPGLWIDLVSTLLVLLAGLVVIVLLASRGTVRVGVLPRDWPAWVVVLLGAAGAVALLVQVPAEDFVPGISQASTPSVDGLPLVLAVLTVLAVPLVSAIATPRQFGVALLAGWIPAALSLVLFYTGLGDSAFFYAVLALVAVIVPFARPPGAVSSRAAQRSPA